jgi:hypothetical protein
MKKILIALVLMMSLVSSSVSPQAISTCTQTVQGTTSINTAYTPFFQEKVALLFSPTGTDGIACDYTVDSTLWEVNGILSNCEDAEGEGCAFVPFPFNNDCCCDQFIPLEFEITDGETGILDELTVEDRDIVVPQALSDLSAALDCLNTGYLAECMDGIDQDGEGTDYPNDFRCEAPWDASETLDDLQTDKPVTSATYFNDIKPCYVRAMKDLGILEQVTSKTTKAFFLVQKLQELEVELQHKLALEDEQAIQDFSVGSEECSGTPCVIGGPCFGNGDCCNDQVCDDGTHLCVDPAALPVAGPGEFAISVDVDDGNPNIIFVTPEQTNAPAGVFTEELTFVVKVISSDPGAPAPTVTPDPGITLTDTKSISSGEVTAYTFGFTVDDTTPNSPVVEIEWATGAGEYAGIATTTKTDSDQMDDSKAVDTLPETVIATTAPTIPLVQNTFNTMGFVNGEFTTWSSFGGAAGDPLAGAVEAQIYEGGSGWGTLEVAVQDTDVVTITPSQPAVTVSSYATFSIANGIKVEFYSFDGAVIQAPTLRFLITALPFTLNSEAAVGVMIKPTQEVNRVPSIAAGMADFDDQVNAVSLMSGTPTGGAILGGLTKSNQSGIFAVAVAAIIVIGIFLFVLRRKP